MPNYCSNKVTLCGDAATVYEMAVFLREQDSPFSFNKVTPLPEALESAQSGSDEQYYKVKYGDWKEVASFGYLTAQGFSFETRDALLQYLKEVRPSVNIDAIADRYHENMTKYGHMSWYSWCVENWGTKWDAGSVSCDTTVGNMELLASAQDTSPVEITYTFDTAWSPPTPVIAKLSELYPTVSITHSYIEEGCVFAGESCTKQGKSYPLTRLKVQTRCSRFLTGTGRSRVTMTKRITRATRATRATKTVTTAKMKIQKRTRLEKSSGNHHC